MKKIIVLAIVVAFLGCDEPSYSTGGEGGSGGGIGGGEACAIVARVVAEKWLACDPIKLMHTQEFESWCDSDCMMGHPTYGDVYACWAAIEAASCSMFDGGDVDMPDACSWLPTDCEGGGGGPDADADNDVDGDVDGDADGDADSDTDTDECDTEAATACANTYNECCTGCGADMGCYCDCCLTFCDCFAASGCDPTGTCVESYCSTLCG